MSTPMSHDDKRTAVAAKLGVPSYHIADMFDDHVVYHANGENDGPQKLQRRSYAVHPTTKEVTIGEPDDVQRVTSYEPVTTTMSLFSSVPPNTDTPTGFIEYVGKVGEIGEWPDKNFALTDEEADSAITRFSPVPNDLEHKSSELDGHLGELQAIWKNGKDLIGRSLIPKWLHDLRQGEPIKTSLAWSRHSKQILKNSIVKNPRITDAQMVAAFSAETDPTPPREPITMPTPTTLADKRWIKALNVMHGSNTLPAEFADFLPEDLVVMSTPPPPVPPNPAEVQFAARIRGMETTMLHKEAVNFAESAVRDQRIFPNEKENLIVRFKQAVLDDRGDQVLFAEDGSLQEGERLKAIQDSITLRPKHGLLDPSNINGNVLFTHGGYATIDGGTSGGGTPADQMSPERRKELLDKGSIKPAQ